MAPLTPTPTTAAPVPPCLHPVPKLLLKVPDLSDAEVFFKAIPNVATSLHNAAERVLAALYPSNLTSSSSHRVKPAPVRSVTLHLRSFDGVAYTCGSALDNEHKELHLSTSYLDGVLSRSHNDVAHLKHEAEGVLVHELVHAFQYDGQGSVPGGVIEGIADWVREKAGLGAPHWREKPSEGGSWDTGYETTGYFLRWLSNCIDNPLLVPELNLAMQSHRWDGGKHLKGLLGGSEVTELWEVYQLELKGWKEGDEGRAPAPVPTHGPSGGYRVQY